MNNHWMFSYLKPKPVNCWCHKFSSDFGYVRWKITPSTCNFHAKSTRSYTTWNNQQQKSDLTVTNSIYRNCACFARILWHWRRKSLHCSITLRTGIKIHIQVRGLFKENGVAFKVISNTFCNEFLPIIFTHPQSTSKNVCFCDFFRPLYLTAKLFSNKEKS